MKKVFLLFAFLLSAMLSLQAQVVDVMGDITTDTHLTSDKTYLLKGFVYVKNGATLTIDPGTIIKGDKATKGALIVTRGAKINAAGTANAPIVFTSNEASPTYGDWGGIILLGRSATNASYNGQAGVGQIEGGVDNANGDGLYGGGDSPILDDNSGVLRYVRIEYPGIAFQPNNEINGLTMGAVGSGTTIDHVQVSYAGDDSYEWFGGTVNCKYLIAYRGLDDDFDCDFGYNGKIQFAFAQRDPEVADVSGSNGFEIDNDGNGTTNTPKTAPTFSNVTICGPNGANTSADFKRANHLRRNSEPGVFNSVFIGSYPVGLFIDGATTASNAQNGLLKVKNSFYHGQATTLSTNDATFDITAFAAANAISTGPNSSDAGLIDPFNLDLPNPRPNGNSPLLGAADFTDARIANSFFTPVSYAGAFGPSGDWTCGWASWPGGNCLPSNQEVTISGDITSDMTFTADKTYILQGFVYVKNCATLTVEPGTIVKGDKGSKGALVVTRCSKLVADGTQDLPIVFTTNDPEPSYGSWGGIILLGRSATNASYNGQAGVGQIEGGVDNANGDGLYGGGASPILDDNSGILRFVRIEYPGIAFQPNNEINGLTMGAVGSGTTIDHVQVSYSGDDSYEWFGGTVNCKHLIAYRGLDDDFDCDYGFSGNLQYCFSVRDPEVADVSGSNGFEVDNDANGTTNTPKTAPTFSNVTIIGPSGANTVSDFKRAAHLRRNCEIGIFNSLLSGQYPVGLYIDGASTIANAQSGLLEVKNTWFTGETELLKTTDAAWDIASWFNTSGWANGTSTVLNGGKLQDPFNLDLPNLQPSFGSPAFGGAAFTSARINKPFFDKVTYVGAFDGTNDWTCGWARFLELNTNCLTETQDAPALISSVKLYPTVANDRVTLELNLEASSDLSVEIYDMQGRFMGQKVSENAVSGKNTYTFQTAELSNGFYFVRIAAGQAVKTEKLIIVK